MKKINFRCFLSPNGINRAEKQQVDIREAFANIIYTRVNGIKAHHLALKIYGSDDVMEYSDDEVKLIRDVAEQFCLPCIIDGIYEQLDKNDTKKEE